MDLPLSLSQCFIHHKHSVDADWQQVGCVCVVVCVCVCMYGKLSSGFLLLFSH